MEEIRKPMFPHAVKWAGIVALAMMAAYLLLYFTGLIIKPLVASVAIIVVEAVMLVLAQRGYRAEMPGVKLSYGKAFAFILFLGLFLVIFMLIFDYLLYSYIATDYYDYLLDTSRIQIMDGRMPEEWKARSLEKLDMTTPTSMAVNKIFSRYIGVLLLGLIASIFGMGVTEIEEDLDTDID